MERFVDLILFGAGSHMVYDVAPYLWHMYRLSIGCVTSCQPFEAINRYLLCTIYTYISSSNSTE